MAFSVLFLLFSLVTTALAQQRTMSISLGSSLSPAGNNKSWPSPSGIFAFGFYPKGNGFAIGIWFTTTPERTVIWTANRDDPPIPTSAVLNLTSDGRLVLQQDGNQEKSIANASGPAAVASMLDSGNFVLYATNSSHLWQSFDHPTDTLLPSQRLLAGNQLVSSASETDRSSGKFLVDMRKEDGDFSIHPKDFQSPYWNTNTLGDNVSLNFEGNGHLFLLNGNGVNIHNITNATQSTSPSRRYRLTIDPGGVLRLYFLDSLNSNWTIQWGITDDVCYPMGICGVNQYCVVMDGQPDCRCLPGYIFFNATQTDLGCYRNFAPENCVSNDENLRSDMRPLDGIEWQYDSPYSVSSPTTLNGCNQTCLDDCSCDAVVFIIQECRKQKLPLKFGRRVQDSNHVTLIKTGNRPFETEPVLIRKRNKKLSISILIISVAFIAFAFIFLAVSLVLISKNRTRLYNRVSKEAIGGLVEGVTLRSFTYEELRRATNGFTEQLGRGAFGTVFKGVLSDDQRVIAVKRLEKVVTEGEVEFQNEMKSIGRTHHRNLVCLLGYCHDKANRILVYPYMSNGSLADFLFKSKTTPSWEERIGIALNIARGIHYLHEECEKQIIHCDINPNNILMDEHCCPKISDFGLAKLLMPDQSRTMTGIRGTRGYVAPEWYKNQPITTKADVYSFGVLFLEIICCRRNVSVEVPEDQAVLAEWVCSCFEANELIKLSCAGDVDQQTLHRMISIALLCIQDEPSLRPSMKKVVLMLEGTLETPVPPVATSFSSVA